MVVRFTSWQISHLTHEIGQNRKFIADQKKPPWIVWPIIAVIVPQNSHSIGYILFT